VEARAALAHGRTDALGGQGAPGLACGALADRSPAGTTRPCPTGHQAEATPGLDKPRERRLPVPAVLVTCPRPADRRPVARAQPPRLATRRFQPSAAPLTALALAPHALGGQLGRGGVLPPGTRERAEPPPLPERVPGGALSPNGAPGLAPHAAEGRGPVRARATSCRGQGTAALTKAGLVAPVPPQGWPTAGGGPGAPAGTGHEGLPARAPDIRRRAIPNHRSATRDDGHVTCRFQERGHPGGQPLPRPAAAGSRRVRPPVRPQGVLPGRDSGVLRPHGRGARAQRRTRLKACPRPARPAERGPHRARQDPPPAPAEARPGRNGGGPLVLRGPLAPNPRGPPC
jgi:hypothetical protein